MLELREVEVEEFAALGIGLIVGVGHVDEEEVEQGVFVLVGELTIGVAPFAIVLVERAVGFVADHRVVRQRHATALTIKGLRRTEQGVDGYAELLGEDLELFGAGQGLSILPTADGLTRDMKALGKLFLCQVVLLA